MRSLCCASLIWPLKRGRRPLSHSGHFLRLDATAEVLEEWMYDALAPKYALDLAMQEWFKKVNPWALQNIAERLLEAVERKMWNAAPEMVDQLRDIYLDVEGELEERTDFSTQNPIGRKG